jgi:alpha-mannosidase
MNENRADAEPYRRAIKDKLKAMAEPLAHLPWRFRVLPSDGSPSTEARSAGDPGGREVNLPFTWSSLDGQGWFHAPVALPAEIEGIALGGSALEWELFLTIGGDIFVDGERRYSEPSWADTRAIPLSLTDSFDPGLPMTLAVRCNSGDGFALFAGSQLRSAAVDAVAFELELALAQADYTRFLARQVGSPGMAVWADAVARLDLGALTRNDWAKWNASVAAMRQGLAGFAGMAKQCTAHLIAHSHIDMNWLWPMQETIEVCRRDFRAMLRLMEAYPEFRFSQSQAATYRFISETDPELYEEIRRQVAAGRWEITANTWVEGDTNMAAGEALARQLLHARRYIADAFSAQPEVCWEPDTFGHTAALPQLLAQCGVRFYYFCRAGRDHPLFWWEAPGGSRVLACQDPNGYNGVVSPGSVVDALLDFAEPAGIRRGLLVYGVGDHGGSGTARDILAARRLDADPLMPRTVPSTAAEFFVQALADLDSGAGLLSLPVVRGELNTVFEGCYTSHGDIKRLNRDAENALLTAETLATLDTLLTGAVHPGEALAEAWRSTCFHQFHDILCGCAIGVTYREAAEAMGAVIRCAASVGAASAKSLGESSAAASASSAPRIVVMNPLGWTRDSVVAVPHASLGASAIASVVDDAGLRLPVQQAGENVLFLARNVPGLGMRMYTPSQEPADDTESWVRSPIDGMLENELIALRVNAGSGAIDWLVDKRNGRSLTGKKRGFGPEARIDAGMLNRLQLHWEQPHPMSAWNIGDIRRIENLIEGADLRVVEGGPVRGVIEVKRSISNSSLRQRIILYAGLPRIDFETEIDWRERGNAHHDAPMLRATFTPWLGRCTASFEAGFAIVERAGDGRETPALRWADLSEGQEYGISLLNDGKYGHSAQGNTLGLTLVRASYEPDVNPDEGIHRFTYALYPHAGDWRSANTPEEAAALNQPLVALVTCAPASGLRANVSWLNTESLTSRRWPGRAIMSALKLAEDQPEQGIAIVVRLYESSGAPAQVRIRVPGRLTSAEILAPDEEPVKQDASIARLITRKNGVRLRLRPHEVATIRLTLSHTS